MCEICYRSPCHPSCPNYEPEICTYCDLCNSTIYVGDEYYEIDCSDICEDCISEYVSGRKKTAEKGD